MPERVTDRPHDMTSDLFLRSRVVFGEAVTLSPRDREAFLRGACGDDTALREEVEALLAESESGTLEGGVREAVRALHTIPQGTRIGPYELVRELGRGGMGTVYLAERADATFRKQVALKLVSAGLDASYFLKRFHDERQILASLSHPNIAMLLDGGTTEDGFPYFVMEYVEGRPIDAFCKDEGAPLPRRLRLFISVCDAVQHAHRNLVVHRDLKPSNILVGKDGVPKLLDFGLARLLTPEAGTERTVTEWRAMTPAYASPEQIRGEPVTTQSDVYSLGVLLFVLLTGRKPYGDAASEPSAMLTAILTAEPLRPRAIDPTIARDLEAIVLKALRKEPAPRYGSVDALTSDVERFLAGRPVAARRGGTAYRARKFARRHWAVLFAAALVAASLVGGLLAANAQRRKAERRFEDVRRLASSYLFEFHDAIRDLPGSTAARALVVKRGLEYLDGLSKEAAGDRALTRELAEAYQRVGDVQGNPFQPNLGDLRGAVESYRKALSLLEPLVSSPLATDEDRAMLAKASLVGGGILATGESRDEALAMQRKGVALRQALADAAPSDRTRRRELAQGLGLLGFNLLSQGRPREALDPLRRQQATLRALLGEQPADADLRRGLGRTLTSIGETYQALGEADRAREAFEESLSIQRALVSERPLSSRFKQDLAYTLGEYAGWLSNSTPAAAALAAFEERLALNRDLEAADPKNAAAKLQVAFSLHSLGEALASLGRPAEALGRFREAARAYDAVLALDPTNSWAALHRAWLDVSEGRSRRQVGETGRACELFLRSASALEELEKNGRLPKTRTSYLADARKERGGCR
ncbi:MAG TPA: protein kinase [Thermoanaerobaculia bacterium]|nr:protein kinase [Thermoanaerobaculia bacterium]